MKKTLPLLSLAVVLGACEKQPEYIMNQDVFCGYRKELACKDKNTFCDNYTETFVCEDANGKKITGRVANLFDIGQKESEFFVKNGVVTGLMQKFYAGGVVREQMNFKNGKLHGVFKEFSSDGKTISVTTFRMGEDIESTKYDYEGSVIGRVYSADGITKYYDNNGRLTSESRMFINKNNDNKEITKEYDENGSLKKISYSIVKEINVNEQISATEEPEYVVFLVGEEEYKNGKLDGMRIRYKPMAEGKQILYSEEWKNGQLNGETKQYLPDGKLIEQTYYKNGIKHGVSHVYFKDGSVWETPYFYGVKHGTERRFYPNGQINEEVDYKNGIWDGVRVHIESQKD